MSKRFAAVLFLTASAASFVVFSGCGQSDQDAVDSTSSTATTAESPKDDYNPHDVPITEEQKTALRGEVAKFPDAVERIKQFRDRVEQETKDSIPKSPYEAHQALDKADLVLQWLPEIARESGVSKGYWEEVNTTANELRTLFETVHQNIDNKLEPDFAGVATQVDQHIARLMEIGKAQPAATEAKP